MIPAPGEGPTVAWADVPEGVHLRGLAPMGIPWRGKKIRGAAQPDEKCWVRGHLMSGCPRGEFAVTHAQIRGEWCEVR